MTTFNCTYLGAEKMSVDLCIRRHLADKGERHPECSSCSIGAKHAREHPEVLTLNRKEHKFTGKHKKTGKQHCSPYSSHYESKAGRMNIGINRPRTGTALTDPAKEEGGVVGIKVKALPQGKAWGNGESPAMPNLRLSQSEERIFRKLCLTGEDEEIVRGF